MQTTKRLDIRHAIWRYVRPPTGRPARRVVGGLCLIVGLSRLGLFAFAAETHVPASVYGWLLICAAVTLWATAYCRLSISGRAASAFGLAVLGSLAIDIFVHGTPGSELSGMILAFLAYVILGETVSTRDDNQQ